METRTERAQHYREEARKYAELANRGQLDITNFARKRLAEQYVRIADDLERRENLTQTMVTLLGRCE
jgi:molecular chaperone GrpE (heat shock protein)